MHPRIHELLDYYNAQRAVLRAAYESVPQPLREAAPAPGRWSAVNVVEHVAIVEARVARALRARIEAARLEGLGADPSTEPIVPTLRLQAVLNRETRVNAPELVQPTGLGGQQAWAALEEATTKVRDMMCAGDGLDLGRVTYPHPIFGLMTLYEWFGFFGAHEARHADQIREQVMA